MNRRLHPHPSRIPIVSEKWKTKLLTEIKTNDVRYKFGMSQIQ